MKTGRRTARVSGDRQVAELRRRLAEADETLRAIRTGEIDALLVTGRQGNQVFTLEGADHAYRVLIESMNEGALTLAADQTIIYANRSFARMCRCPLERVMGGSFDRFLAAGFHAALRPLLRRVRRPGATIQAELIAGDGSLLPVQISVRPLPRKGSDGATVGLVVTDLTDARRAEEMLRSLTHRVVQAQEAERGRVALELHDNITQLLCAVLFRSQVLADKLAARSGSPKREAWQLCRMLGKTAGEVERISRSLRPSALDHLGLAAILNDASREFEERTGVPVKVACPPLVRRLPAEVELGLYRVLQEALQNAEKHARARHVTVSLRRQGNSVQLTVADDGIGFDADHQTAAGKASGRLGLLGMRERAAYLGGVLTIRSNRRAGTRISVRVPLHGRPPVGRT